MSCHPLRDMSISRAREHIKSAHALIFDVDGTLAETEEAHRQAFNEAFKAIGLDWCWGRTIYKDLLRVAGGKERIRAFDRIRRNETPLSDAEIANLHRIKTDRYVELVSRGGCPLRPGVEALLTAAESRGQKLAIATTTSRENIDVLLSVGLGPDWSGRFAAIVAGDEVPKKKPAPDVYVEALARLKLSASDCIAIEDSSNGLLAALGVAIPVIITHSVYFLDEDFSEALIAVDSLTELTDP